MDWHPCVGLSSATHSLQLAELTSPNLSAANAVLCQLPLTHAHAAHLAAGGGEPCAAGPASPTRQVTLLRAELAAADEELAAAQQHVAVLQQQLAASTSGPAHHPSAGEQQQAPGVSAETLFLRQVGGWVPGCPELCCSKWTMQCMHSCHCAAASSSSAGYTCVLSKRP